MSWRRKNNDKYPTDHEDKRIIHVCILKKMQTDDREKGDEKIAEGNKFSDTTSSCILGTGIIKRRAKLTFEIRRM